MSVRQWRGSLPIVDNEGSNFFCSAGNPYVSQYPDVHKEASRRLLDWPRHQEAGRGVAWQQAARTFHCD